jgi:hypothetical protein
MGSRIAHHIELAPYGLDELVAIGPSPHLWLAARSAGRRTGR